MGQYKKIYIRTILKYLALLLETEWYIKIIITPLKIVGNYNKLESLILKSNKSHRIAKNKCSRGNAEQQ